MQLNYNTTIHLSAADCEQIIKAHLKNKQNVEVTNITFEFSKELCGYGMSERECVNFKGITVRCNKDGLV